MANRFPAVFVSHGAPTLVLEGGPACDFLRALGPKLGKPKAILCVSAHWETDAPAVSAAANPETIHDFHGFPRALYEMRYSAPGSPALAERSRGLLRDIELDCAVDPMRGLDHGAWVPLRLMYPDADVPALQLSIQTGLGPAHHLALGRALAPLREEGVLVMGSGSAIHNLRELRRDGRGPDDWAVTFAEWLVDRVEAGAADDLVHYRTRAPNAVRAHPTDEHLLPLHVALGAGGMQSGRRAFEGFTHGNLGMHAFAWV